MARGRISDRLLSHEFHVLDIDPSLAVPPWVLLPSTGFSSVTMPEMTINTEEINEGTSYAPHKVLGKLSNNTITLSRGATVFNSDFFRWIISCIKGDYKAGNFGQVLLEAAKNLGSTPATGKRRNLMIFQFTGIGMNSIRDIMKSSSTPLEKAKAAAFAPAMAFSSAVNVLNEAAGGIFGFGINSIPGRVFVLYDCLPVRYKPGSDLDASSSEISISELDVEFHSFEEFSLAL